MEIRALLSAVLARAGWGVLLWSSESGNPGSSLSRAGPGQAGASCSGLLGVEIWALLSAVLAWAGAGTVFAVLYGWTRVVVT